ncbi:MAG: hypothetical protein F4128_10500 [Gammaproteobacteria bacterium]|nr:hypothetical protein [Gammaproteobacteria bacterium]
MIINYLWVGVVPFLFVLIYLTSGWGVVVLHLIGGILVTVAFYAWTRWQDNRMRGDDPQDRQKGGTP